MRKIKPASAVLVTLAAGLAFAASAGAQDPAPVDLDQGFSVTRLLERLRSVVKTDHSRPATRPVKTAAAAEPDPRPMLQHPPFKEGDCDMCHVPDGPPAVKAPLSGACFECHSELSQAMEKKVVHSPFREGDCTACHAPHESRERAFLKAPAQELCLGCHEIDVKDHPVSGHPAFKPGRQNPRDPSKPFDCSSCHEPHGNDQPKLVRWDANGNYGSGCQTCHKM